MAIHGSEELLKHTEIVAFIVLSLMIVLVVIAFRMIFITLSRQAWSLKDALSEEVVLSKGSDQNPADTSPSQAKVLAPSSSRFIALNGMVLIGVIYLGTGLYIVFALFCGGVSAITDLKKNIDAVDDFLLYGAALFVPYVFNKLTSLAK